jgi:hypothetical protein
MTYIEYFESLRNQPITVDLDLKHYEDEFRKLFPGQYDIIMNIYYGGRLQIDVTFNDVMARTEFVLRYG